MRSLLWLIALPLLVSCESSEDLRDPLRPLECRGAGEPRIDQFEIGGDVGAFAPWSDGDTAVVELGIQGLFMIVVREHVHGAVLPRCMRQRTLVTLEGTLVGQYSGAVPIVPEGPGVGVTEPIFAVIFDRIPQPGEDVVVESEVGGRKVSRRLRIGKAQPLDGGVEMP